MKVVAADEDLGAGFEEVFKGKGDKANQILREVTKKLD